jgi:hypothetical protein
MSNANRSLNKQILPKLESLADAPFHRRKFLTALAAGTGSLALAACGGGGVESDVADATAKDAELNAVGKAASSTQKWFYGMNGHMAWGNNSIYQTMSAAQQLALLKDLGATVYRADVADAGMATTVANALKGPFAGSGVTIMPVLNPRSAGWDQSAGEDAGYKLGYALAVRCTTPLKGLVKYIECGNELDVIGMKIAGDGSKTSDWSHAYWPAFRGVIRGMLAGVRSVDPSIQCGVNVGIPMAYRALQMLWNGITPNGTSTGYGGSLPARWDFTTYHWYKSSYNIQKAGPTASVDVLQILKDSFGKPIWLTEWGWSGSKDTAASAAAYVTQAMAQYKSIKDKYNIQCIMMYDLIDSSYGLIQADGVTKNPAYAAFKNFVAANPV